MTESIAIITSGAYVNADIAAEFGLIPPAFLPIGNRRLYVWQVEALRQTLPDIPIYLTVPADYEVGAGDRRQLDELGVTVVHSLEGLSLGAAVAFAVLSTGNIDKRLLILHGDTLLLDYPFDKIDAVSGGVTDSYYAWGAFSRRRNGALRIREEREVAAAAQSTVLTGAFFFADTPLFLKCLAVARNRFVEAIALYSEARALEVVEEGRWLDFGHLHTYFQSRRRITSERHFNRLESKSSFFVKSSVKKAKVEAERDWFLGLPDDLKIFAPLVLEAPASDDFGAYMIEYIHAAPLSDIYVFGQLPASVWRTVFAGCNGFLTAAAAHKGGKAHAAGWSALYEQKTLSRLDAFAANAGVDLDAEWTINGRRTPSLRRITELMAKDIGAPAKDDITIVHGDFCFSNILFDFRAQRIKVIDPRGIDAKDRPTLFGDRRYETAKLHHSVVGRYDYILAGFHETRRPSSHELELALPDDARTRNIQAIFQETAFGGRGLDDLKAHQISVLLFLSMLPLHADDASRQLALLANGLRLYAMLEGEAG